MVLGLFTSLSGCGWFVSGRKHRQEVNSLKADNRLKDMELARLYVEQFQVDIAEPLRQEVRELRSEVSELRKLRNEVIELRDAITMLNDCRYLDECPVRDRLLHHLQPPSSS